MRAPLRAGSRWAALALGACVLASCAGKVVGDGRDDAGDGGGDTPVVPPDGSGTCGGAGGCSPGATCSPDGCNTCTCNAGGTGWACTLMACVDADPPPPPPPPGCPARSPVNGLPCLGSATCRYTSACGTTVTAVCASGRWTVTVVPCP